MTNQEKAMLSLIGVGLLAGTFQQSARKAGWSAAAISTAFFVAAHPDKVKKLIG